MISLMTLALIWSRFWRGEPRHRQSLVGSRCPFCTSLVPSAGSAPPSSWFTHSWVHIKFTRERTHTHTRIHACTHTQTWAWIRNVALWSLQCWKLMKRVLVNRYIYPVAERAQHRAAHAKQKLLQYMCYTHIATIKQGEALHVAQLMTDTDVSSGC